MFSHTPDTRFDLRLSGVIRQGHGVASGCAEGSPYPEGTLALQIPIFKSRGVDLGVFHRGTLNVDISPERFRLSNADVTLRQVSWTDRIPPEDFSFCACLLEAIGAVVPALIYYPHPETKVEHFQSESLIEILAPFVSSLHPGSRVELRVCRRQVRLSET